MSQSSGVDMIWLGVVACATSRSESIERTWFFRTGDARYRVFDGSAGEESLDQPSLRPQPSQRRSLHQNIAETKVQLGMAEITDDRPSSFVTGSFFANSGAGTTWVLSLCFILLFLTISLRVHNRLPDPSLNVPSGESMLDFRDVVYFPTKSWLLGKNPYDIQVVDQYSTGQQPFLSYSPLLLLIHSPFAILPFKLSCYAYHVFNLLMLLVFVSLILPSNITGRGKWNAILFFSTATLMTYPMYRNFMSGQVTLLVVIGAVLALRNAEDRPFLSGLGIAIASIKPTYGVPLVFFFLIRRSILPLLIGSVIGVVGAGIPSIKLILDSNSFNDFRRVMFANLEMSQHFHDPATTWTRLDLLAILDRLFEVDLLPFQNTLILILVISIACLSLARLWRPLGGRGFDGISVAVVVTSSLVCVFHNTYDAVYLVYPVVVMVCDEESNWNCVSQVFYWGALILMIIPLLNWMPSQSLIEIFQLDGGPFVLAMSINGLSIFLAWVFCLLGASQTCTRTESDA